MNIVETTQVATGALPLAALREHLRVGTGFGNESLQDGVLEACLRAALARVEGYCGKAVLARGFLLSIDAWRDLSRQILPLAPVSAVSRVSVFDRQGGETVIAPASYRLIRDDHRPMLISAGYSLPTIPLAGRIEIGFDAGFAEWGAVPADIRQAVLILAARYYEFRDAGDAGELPAMVAGLLARFRVLRLGGGALS